MRREDLRREHLLVDASWRPEWLRAVVAAVRRSDLELVRRAELDAASSMEAEAWAVALGLEACLDLALPLATVVTDNRVVMLLSRREGGGGPRLAEPMGRARAVLRAHDGLQVDWAPRRAVRPAHAACRRGWQAPRVGVG